MRGGEVAAVGDRERGKSVGSDWESPASIYSFDSSPMLDSAGFKKVANSALHGGNLPTLFPPDGLGKVRGASWGSNLFSGSGEEAYACSLEKLLTVCHNRSGPS